MKSKIIILFIFLLLTTNAFSKENKKNDIINDTLYFLGALFPVTNLIGFPFYINEQARDISAAAFFISIPVIVMSTSSLITSIIVYPIGIYNYINNYWDFDKNILIIVPSVFLGISYFINFMFGLALFLTSLDKYHRKYKQKTNLGFIFDLDYNNNRIIAGLSCKF